MFEAVLTPCKLYQNITSRMVFMIVFGIDCNFFIVLPVRLKTCNLMVCCFLQSKMCDPEKSGALSFSWSRQMFPVRHFAYFVPAQGPLQLWNFFQLLLSVFSINFIESVSQIMQCFTYFSVIGCIPDALSSALHFDLYFFTNRLYRLRTDLRVTLKRGSSTNEFKIAAISSHACPLFTLPWRCIHG